MLSAGAVDLRIRDGSAIELSLAMVTGQMPVIGFAVAEDRPGGQRTSAHFGCNPPWIFHAVQLGADTINITDLPPNSMLRLRHEIAERISQLLPRQEA